MQKVFKIILFFFLLSSASPLFAFKWLDLWQTQDQQGAALLKSGKHEDAAKFFNNESWRAVAHYRAKNHLKAYQYFSRQKTSDGQYNAGNAAAFLSRYQDAIKAYDKAIALNPNNRDAITNREIVKRLLKKNQQKNSSAKNSNNEKQSQNKKNEAQQNNKNQSPKNTSDNNKSDTQNSINKSQINSQKPNANGPSANSKKLNTDANTTKRLPIGDENKKQLLRRVADDPGGLLRQKFLRDYLRRHAGESDQDEGDN